MISLGLPGATDPAILRVIAERAEQLGVHALWLNDTPTGDALAGLAAVAEVTTTLRLGVGVIPVDRRPAADILRGAQGLPEHRLTIGIGSGGPTNALARVRDAVDELKQNSTAAIAIGALGPKMRTLAAEMGDAVLLNWLTPETATRAMGDLRVSSGDRGVRGILYARSIADAAARPALIAEADTYAGFPSYAANFARLHIRALDTTIDGTDGFAAAAPFEAAVDEVVLRAVTPSGSESELLHFLDVLAPSL